MTILFYLTSFLLQLSGSKRPSCLTATQLNFFFLTRFFLVFLRYSLLHLATFNQALSIKDEMLRDKHNDMGTKCKAEI